MTTDYDALLLRFILHRYQERYIGEHLAECPEAAAENITAEITFMCDTGCEGTWFRATISCPHGEHVEHDWSEWSDLPDILEEFEKFEAQEAGS